MRKIRNLVKKLLKPIILEIINTEIRVWGSAKLLSISKKAGMVNTLFNTSAGNIEIGDYTFTGHNVSIITGTHSYDLFLEERMYNFSQAGGDIKIGKGVWIGSNATILGPCKIGDHAVIAAGALVPPNSQIPSRVIVAGIPARTIKVIQEAKSTTVPNSD